MIVQRHRRVADGVDRYGKPKYRNEDSSVTVIAFAPTIQGETDDTEEVTVRYGGSLYLYPNTDVTETDAFTIYGERYEADGPKARWPHPRSGWHPGDVLILKRSAYTDA